MRKRTYILMAVLMAGIATLSAMGAPNVVPRTDGVETLGTSSKSWGHIYANTNTMQNGEVWDNAPDGTVTLVGDDSDAGLIVDLKTVYTTNGTVTLKLTGDAGGDAGDIFGLHNNGQGTLSIQSDASVKGTLADKITITSAGAVTIPGDVTASADVRVGLFGGFSVGNVTVTNGAVLTATNTYTRVELSGETATLDATTSIADGGTAGDLLIIENISTNDLVIKNAANTLMSGDRTMGAGLNSTTTFIWNGSDWVGVCESDN